MKIIFGAISVALLAGTAALANPAAEAYNNGLSAGQEIGTAMYGQGYAEGLGNAQSIRSHSYNEGFLDTYGAFTGSTPGPVEVPFGSTPLGGFSSGTSGILERMNQIPMNKF